MIERFHYTDERKFSKSPLPANIDAIDVFVDNAGPH
jgi:hypothetical protein